MSRNLSGITALGNANTLPSGVRALVKYLQNLEDRLDNLSSTSSTSSTGGVSAHDDLTDMPDATGENIDHDVRYKRYSGFENRTDSEFVTADLTASGLFSIQPASSSFDVWTNGRKWTFTEESAEVTVTADKTITYIYIDTDGVLKKSTTAWDLSTGLQAPVAIVFKDGSTYAVTDERHGHQRNPSWHNWAHVHIGAMYNSGLTGSFTNTTFSISQGSISDEDIDFDTGGSKTTCSLWYRDGANNSMRLVRGSTKPYSDNAGVLRYDNAGVLANADSNRYVSSWVYCSNDDSEPIYVVIGQTQHVNISTARNEASPEIRLSTAEWKLLYHVIFRNTSPITYIEAIDYRQVQTGSPSNAVITDHASLINRDAANAHPATSISIADSGSYFTGETVEAALQELGAGGGGGGGSTTTDVYASRPAAGNDGNLFLPQDGIYLNRDNGVSWESWGPVYRCKNIDLTEFTWDNQGAATATATKGGVYFYAPKGTTNARVLYKSVTGNYTVTLGFIPHLVTSNYQSAGIALRESSTGKLILGGIHNSAAYGLYKWDDATSYNAAYTITSGNFNPPSVLARSQIIWLRLSDDGTNRKYYVSYNGMNWEEIFSVGRTDFCTPNQVGFYIDDNNSTYNAYATFLHFEVT
jgi:hypothetical protein